MIHIRVLRIDVGSHVKILSGQQRLLLLHVHAPSFDECVCSKLRVQKEKRFIVTTFYSSLVSLKITAVLGCNSHTMKVTHLVVFSIFTGLYNYTLYNSRTPSPPPRETLYTLATAPHFPSNLSIYFLLL